MGILPIDVVNAVAGKANGKFDTQIRSAELKPFVVRVTEQRVFRMRYDEADSGLAPEPKHCQSAPTP